MIRAVGGDLAAFFAAFEEGHESADIDQNGGVEGGDLALFLQWSEAGFAGDHTLDAQRYLYRGYHWDDALKMYHVRHRVYDPARMLWIQRDPLGRIPGANEYAYCLGEPIDFYDPMGLWGEQTATRMVNSEWAAERALGWVVGTVGGAAEQVASSVEAMANATPESIAEGIAGTVEQGIKREDKYAEHGGYDPSLVGYALTIAAEFVGANEAAAGIAGVDVLEDRLITDNWERFERAGTGLAQMFETGAGLAGGAVGGLRSAGTGVTKTSTNLSSNTKTAGKGGPEPVPPKCIEPIDHSGPQGIVYKRTDPRTGEEYIGQTKSLDRFSERQSEHDKALGVQHKYKILGRAHPGIDLDVLEETYIRLEGGIQKEGGTLANKRHQMREERYRKHGGQAP